MLAGHISNDRENHSIFLQIELIKSNASLKVSHPYAIVQCCIILFAPLDTGLRPGLPPAPCILPWRPVDSLQLARGDLLDPHTFHLQFIIREDKTPLILSGVQAQCSISVYSTRHPLAAFPSADMSFKWKYASSRDHAVPVL